MPATLTPAAMTTDELLALPDDGVERWLVKGQLREKRLQEKPMTVRNRFHSEIMMTIGKFLGNWNDEQPKPRGKVLGGEAGVRLTHDPDTTFGVDVVYIDAEMAARQSDNTTLLEGVPVLVVEITSPSDTAEEIDEKIDAYQEAGVPLVWVVDPHDRTVLVYRPGADPQLFSMKQEIANEPRLPGLRLPVARIFE